MATIFGTDGVDLLNGTELDDFIYGYARGRKVFDTGADVIDGNKGNDFIDGAGGNDLLTGGEGDDFIRGGNGFDRIFGGKDQDTLFGDAGNDTIDGGEGADALDGGAGRDSLLGGDGDDTAAGGNGVDTIDGGLGDDTIYGDVIGIANAIGHGADQLFGGEGTDSIFGGGGADFIEGGSGQDFLTGDAGNDVFRFVSNWDFDVVRDFQDGFDKLNLSGQGISFADLRFEMTDADSDGSTDDLLIKIDTGSFGEIALLNTDIALMGVTDFIL